MESILEQLQQLLRDYTGIPDISIDETTLLATDIGLDSYDLACMMGEAEERFDIVITDRDLLSMLTIGDVVNYIEAHTP
ncbi:MAG: acyl carrier protein [Oscillospiraceae bacterium]|jgi:acyl carrier protein|nr:acyl carrier protein [Oscillospiraceae bacterium]